MKHSIFLCIVYLLAWEEAMAAPKSKLATYQKRREFTQTPEPRGRVKKKSSADHPLFVIQMHDASHLHYDFRLEIDGVLKSWAVPKGPDTDPAVKRLAIETEDHPMEYAHFEGIIPQGHYGGGTVMVWDIGTFENIKKKNNTLASLSECYKQGRLEFYLHGKKLKGAYALVKTKGMSAKNSWLIIKMNDEYAHKRITNKTKSALTGRTLKQIASDKDAVWE